MKHRGAGVALIAVLLAVLGVAVWRGVDLYQSAQERIRVKEDYRRVHSVENGIMSVDVWVGELRRIIAHQIRRFSLTPDERATLQRQITDAMNALLDRLEHTHAPSLKGKVGKLAARTLLPRSEVPKLADALIDDALAPGTRRAAIRLALEKLDQYAAETRNEDRNRHVLDDTLARYHVHGRRAFDRIADARAEAMQARVRLDTNLLIGALFLCVGAWALVLWQRRHLAWTRQPVYFLSLAIGLVVLVTSVAAPMIEIDARIRHVDLLLLGEHVRFEDQVLFYQARSILQVVMTLFAAARIDSIFVGALVLLFSIATPIAKLVCTELVLLGRPSLARNRVLRYLAFETGKWQMADVLVVGMFMSFMGFRGLMEKRMGSMDTSTSSLSLVSTHHTALQPAYLMFICFMLFSLVLAEFARRAAKREQAGGGEAR